MYKRQGHGNVAAAELPAALGHGPGHRLGHSAVGVQRLLRYAQHLGFHIVDIAHHAAPKDLGGPGQVGDCLLYTSRP